MLTTKDQLNVATVEELRKQFKDVLGQEFPVPFHALRRLHALLGNDELVFVDGRMTIDTPSVYSGALVAFTDRNVFTIKLSRATDKLDPSQDGTSTVDVRVWPRRALSHAAIREDPQNRVNTDDRWRGGLAPDGAPQPERDSWPDKAKLYLRYRDREDPLVLPFGDLDRTGATQFAALVLSLMNDLN